MPGIDLDAIVQLLQSKRGSRPAGIASGGRQLPMEAIQRRLMEAPLATALVVDSAELVAEWVEGMGGGMPSDPGMMPPEEMGNIGMEGTGLDGGVGGMSDPRGLVGELARGANMYPGGGPAQSGGGMQFGRPPEDLGAPDMSMSGVPGMEIAGLEGMPGMEQGIPGLDPVGTPGMEGMQAMGGMGAPGMPDKNAVLRRILAQRSGNGLFA